MVLDCARMMDANSPDPEAGKGAADKGEGLKPTVSVVVATRDRADLLRHALDSVLAQTYPPLEIILVDDASDDPHAYAGMESMDPRIRLVRNEHCLGPGGARNVGIGLARGDLVAFLDDDDEWVPDKLRKQVHKFHSDPEIGAVYCLCKWHDLQTGVIYPHLKATYRQGWILPEQLVADHTCGTPTYLIRRDLLLGIGGFDPSLLAREDWDLSIRLAGRCKIACVDEDLVIAGWHARAGVSKHFRNLLEAQERILRKYSPLRKELGFAVACKARSRYFASGGMLHSYLGNRLQAIRFHLLAIISWPLYLAHYSGLVKAFLPLSMRKAFSQAKRKLHGRR